MAGLSDWLPETTVQRVSNGFIVKHNSGIYVFKTFSQVSKFLAKQFEQESK